MIHQAVGIASTDDRGNYNVIGLCSCGYWSYDSDALQDHIKEENKKGR